MRNKNEKYFAASAHNGARKTFINETYFDFFQ